MQQTLKIAQKITKIFYKLFHIKYIIFHIIFSKIYLVLFINITHHVFGMFAISCNYITSFTTFIMFHDVCRYILVIFYAKYWIMISQKWQHWENFSSLPAMLAGRMLIAPMLTTACLKSILTDSLLRVISSEFVISLSQAQYPTQPLQWLCSASSGCWATASLAMAASGCWTTASRSEVLNDRTTSGRSASACGHGEASWW